MTIKDIDNMMQIATDLWLKAIESKRLVMQQAANKINPLISKGEFDKARKLTDKFFKDRDDIVHLHFHKKIKQAEEKQQSYEANNI